MNLHQTTYIKNKVGGEQSFTARLLDYNSLRIRLTIFLDLWYNSSKVKGRKNN
nr:MAG TPA: hypothetical protein [Caudoviricetes sp.]